MDIAQWIAELQKMLKEYEAENDTSIIESVYYPRTLEALEKAVRGLENIARPGTETYKADLHNFAKQTLASIEQILGEEE